MRKTKIICTIGPASENEKTIEEMALAGMNVARLNFSHNTYDDHLNRISIVKKVREKLNLPIAIMLDTKGPEYRIKTFENGKISLKKGDKYTFTTDDAIGNQNIVSVSYKNLHIEMSIGDKILVNTGLSSFTVVSIEGFLDNLRYRGEQCQYYVIGMTKLKLYFQLLKKLRKKN